MTTVNLSNGWPVLCDWDTGTAGSGPRKCTHPAKYRVVDDHSGTPTDRPVCGVHRRKARGWRWETEPLTKETAS